MISSRAVTHQSRPSDQPRYPSQLLNINLNPAQFASQSSPSHPGSRNHSSPSPHPPPKPMTYALNSDASSYQYPLHSASASPSFHPPTPFTASVRPVPVPSKTQVNDYLVSHMSMPRGLKTGWLIDGKVFNVYALFAAVLQIGGSSEVGVHGTA